MSGYYAALVGGGVLALLYSVRRRHLRKQHEQRTRNMPNGKSRFIFIGSGCSGGTPISLCLLGLIPGRPVHGCAVCRSAYENPNHPNHRRNPCALIQNPSRTLNTLIDCGKTFREAALTWFPRYGVRGIDHILITHEHADAVFGLDEIRMVQNVSRTSPLRTSPPPPITMEEFTASRRKEVLDCLDYAVNQGKSRSGSTGQDPAEKSIVQNNTQSKSHPLGAMYDEVIVHCFERTMKAIQNSFPWLVSKGKGAVPRFVSQLRFEAFDLSLESKFKIDGFYDDGSELEVIPLPVDHGADFMCAGFQFGRNDVVVYISDVSKIPDVTLAHLQAIPRIRLYVVDALRPVNYEKATRPMVHFDLADALESIRQLGKPPVETYLVGMGHEFDYDSTNEALATLPVETYGQVRCARDGLALDLDI